MNPWLGYAVVANWNARSESPEDLAVRWIEAFRHLQTLDPAFSRWYGLKKGRYVVTPLDLTPAPVADWIADGVAKARDGTHQPFYGYRCSAFNFFENKWTPRGFKFSLGAGSDIASRQNTSILSTADGLVPDPSLVTFEIFRTALLALAESFEATVAFAHPDAFIKLRQRGERPRRLPLAWLSYLAPRFAPMITPPAGAIVERRPDGGLLMAATDATFRVDDPAHMAVAHDIAAAVAPFNALPWPQEAHNVQTGD